MVSTSWRHVHEPSERDLRLFDILARQAADVIERARADVALRESEEKFSKLFEKAAMVAVLSKMPRGEMIDVNESFETLFGFTKEEVIGKTSQELGINRDKEMRRETVASLKADGFVRDQEMRLYTKSGEALDCLVNIVIMEFGGENYALSTLQDITKRKRAEDMQQLLLGELNHRVKNMLATIQAIAQQTLRHTREPEDFVASFSGRIQSLGRVHSLLTDATWRGAALKDLIRDQLVLGAVDETRFIVKGPAVNLLPQTALHLALMLHELGTNSIKYGALKRPNGTVNIDWTVEDGKLQLNWAEHGVPDIREPSARGFGLTLIERSAAGQGGAAQFTVGSDGLACAITLPLENS
jgi:PAS domain S-box-containing protein